MYIDGYGKHANSIFLSGGNYGTISLGYSVVTLYICLVVNGWYRWFLLISDFVVEWICFYLLFQNNPGADPAVTWQKYMILYSATILLSLVVAAIVMFQNYLFKIEKDRSDKRKDEVEQLSQAQSRFFSGMSHEIRTPINTIIGLNEMTLRENASDEVIENARNIQAASNMLLHLINDILDMSKLESGRMELVSVPYHTGEMFSDIVGMIWIRAKEKNLDFHIAIDPMLPEELIGDEVRIKQVLINLLTNAVKYTKEGSITLNVQFEKKTERQAVVTYSVSDTGTGIKKESIPELFTAFKRIDETENRYIEGTGLGLSIASQFVEMMGGTINVNSVYTQGSTFIVSIPQGIENEHAIGELNLEARNRSGYRNYYRQSFEAPEAKILVVDDTLANLLVVEKLLRDTKVQVDTVTNGNDALKKTLEVPYDLILMDHLMPEMDGVECMHRIHKQQGGLCRDTKVIALTANAGSDSQALYLREGFEGYLVKPVSGESLEAEVAHKLPRHLVHYTKDVEAVVEENKVVSQKMMRTSVVITTETGCDLPEKYILEHGIDVIPFHLQTSNGDFYDGVEAETRGLLSYMEDGVCDARSLVPSILEYEMFFADNLIRANHVIHISMSSKVGKAFEKASEAAQTFDNVTVIDSRHLSSGMGLLVMEAVRMANEGMRYDQIIDQLGEIRGRISSSFIVSNTEYLSNAGWLGSTINTLSHALLFRSAIVVKNGKMVAKKAYFGSEKNAWIEYIDDTLKGFRKIDRRRIFITHAGLNMEELRLIRNEIDKRVNFNEVIYQKASSAIAANCGPGTFGILFMMDK